ARQFGTSKYGLSRVYKVFLDLISIKTLLLFIRQPMKRFTGLALLSFLLTLLCVWQVVSGIGATEGGSVMVSTAVAMLFGSLTLFLLLLGAVATLVHRRAGTMDPVWLKDR
ncbi:MAG: glycosyltransferase, partial [Pseudomonadota bacterium]